MNIMIDAMEKTRANIGDIIITQGDIGDYFYVLRDGHVRFEVSGIEVGRAGKGKSFGELALLYTSPRAASVIADEKSTLYRVDQKTFRYIMQDQTLQAENKKKELLKGISFLEGFDPSDLNKLCHAMTPLQFNAGEYLLVKGDEGDQFFLLQEGIVTVRNITIGSTNYEDTTLGPGDYFGERALMAKEPRTADCVAESDGTALTIDRETFEKVIGKFSFLVQKAEDKRKLVSFCLTCRISFLPSFLYFTLHVLYFCFCQASLKIFSSSHLSQQALTSLAGGITDYEYKQNQKLITEGQNTVAQLYFVREGKVRITSSDGQRDNIVDKGGYFGDDMLELDLGGLKKTSTCVAKYTVTALSSGAVCGVLPLRICRNHMDTTKLTHVSTIDLDLSKIELGQLERHSILGAGTFGQVWLVTNPKGRGKSNFGPYALKIQTKFELLKSHQAKGVIQEKNLLEVMHHPFVINLVETYQVSLKIYHEYLLFLTSSKLMECLIILSLSFLPFCLG